MSLGGADHSKSRVQGITRVPDRPIVGLDERRIEVGLLEGNYPSGQGFTEWAQTLWACFGSVINQDLRVLGLILRSRGGRGISYIRNLLPSAPTNPVYYSAGQSQPVFLAGGSTLLVQTS